MVPLVYSAADGQHAKRAEGELAELEPGERVGHGIERPAVRRGEGGPVLGCRGHLEGTDAQPQSDSGEDHEV